MHGLLKNELIMKKIVLFIFAYFFCVGHLFSQTPIYDPTRVYDVVTDADSCYLFSMPKPCFDVVRNGFLPNTITVQEYVPSDTVVVYGVAITTYWEYIDPFHDGQTNFYALINVPRGHINPTLGYDYLMETVDTVTFNRAHPRFCWFQYSDGCSNTKDMRAHCYELYFDTPDRINVMTDTFYVGYKKDLDALVFPQVYGGQYDNSLPGTLYSSGIPIEGIGDTVYRQLDYYDQKLWGVAFPIIGFRCGPMEEYWVDSLAADSALVRWRKVEQGTLFNVRLVGSDGSDTTYVTADTSLALGGLADTVRYNVMLRKQCRYTTTNYDTTVYGAWLSTLYFGHGPEAGVGVAAVQGEAFFLVPNPARERVSVVLPASMLGGRLSVLDMAGRERMALPVQEPVEDLDVSALSPGIYLVRITTARDVSTRRLLVLRD